MKKLFSMNRNLLFSIVGFTLLFVWFVLPMPHIETFPAVTRPVDDQTVYVQNGGMVDKIYVKRGDQVVVGQPLISIFSKPLETRIATMEAEVQVLQAEINALTEDEKERSIIPEKQAELASTEEFLVGLYEKRNQNLIQATVSGVVYKWEETLQVGQAVAQEQVLGGIVDPSGIEVIAFMPEKLLRFIEQGGEVSFRPSGSSTEISGKIRQVSPVRARYLNYLQLSSTVGGDLPVSAEANTGRELMIETFYPVEVEINPEKDQVAYGKTGVLVVRGQWRSKAVALMRSLGIMFWEESSF